MNYPRLDYTERQLLKFDTVRGAPSNRAPAVYAPTSLYVLPQININSNTPWGQVTTHMVNPTRTINNRYLDWKSIAQSTCSTYSGSIAPRSQQDCPDSSFTFVTDMGRLVGGASGPGCIQLGTSSQPHCYSDSQGNYQPWWAKINASSP